jgi:rare lipoprotein A
MLILMEFRVIEAAADWHFEREYAAMQHMNAISATVAGYPRPRVASLRSHAYALAAVAALLVSTPTGQGPAFVDTLPDWMQQGRVSWYGPGFHGRRTANGEVFDTNALTMAHRSLDFGSEVRVTNLENGRSVVVRVNDRGPYVRGRIADLSRAAADELGFVDDGVVRARIELL